MAETGRIVKVLSATGRQGESPPARDVRSYDDVIYFAGAACHEHFFELKPNTFRYFGKLLWQQASS